jgi:hypothetical protein
VIILDKQYDGESIVDLNRDVSEMLDEKFDPRIKTIPRDKYGFMQGTFKLTVEWVPE